MDDAKQNKSISFYISSGSKDLLNKVNDIMAAKGIMGYRDQEGRYHYLIDGSKGAPFAAMRLDDVARLRLNRDLTDAEEAEINAEFYVDAVLSCYNFDRSLQGFFQLRYMLIRLILDPRLRQPLTKTLYPLAARAHNCSVSQIERNVRYCLRRLKQREKNNSPGMGRFVFKEDAVFMSSAHFRSLDDNLEKYTNSDAIRLLEREIRQLIKIDKKRAVDEDSPEKHN